MTLAEKRVVRAAMRFAPHISEGGGYVDHRAYAHARVLRGACAAIARAEEEMKPACPASQSGRHHRANNWWCEHCGKELGPRRARNRKGK